MISYRLVFLWGGDGPRCSVPYERLDLKKSPTRIRAFRAYKRILKQNSVSQTCCWQPCDARARSRLRPMSISIMMLSYLICFFYSSSSASSWSSSSSSLPLFSSLLLLLYSLCSRSLHCHRFPAKPFCWGRNSEQFNVINNLKIQPPPQLGVLEFSCVSQIPTLPYSI